MYCLCRVWRVRKIISTWAKMVKKIVGMWHGSCKVRALQCWLSQLSLPMLLLSGQQAELPTGSHRGFTTRQQELPKDVTQALGKAATAPAVARLFKFTVSTGWSSPLFANPQKARAHLLSEANTAVSVPHSLPSNSRFCLEMSHHATSQTMF